jgi:formylglycine-generating enzyme required for sulfatase activity
VTHRDVKPDNLLVDQAGNVRVADFGLGLSEDADRMTRTGARLGTPSFMAPEQVDGDRERQGPATDVWALGVMLYEALTGERPFVGQTLPLLFKAIAEAEFRLPREVDSSLDSAWDAVVSKALQYETSDRYRNGEALARDIERALAGEPVNAPTTSPWARRWRRWRRVLLPLSAMALCALLLASGDPFSAPKAEGEADRDSPVLTLTAPVMDLVETSERSLVLTGSVEDASEWVALKVDGDTHRVAPSETFSILLPLESGENKVTVRATDASGNRSEARRLTILCTLPSWYLRLPESERPPVPLPPGLRVTETQGEYLWEKDGSVLLWVPPGSFRLGWARNKPPLADMSAMRRFEHGDSGETIERDVTLTRGYWIGKYEVTWGQFDAFLRVLGRPLPSRKLTVRITEGAVPGENKWEFDGPPFVPGDDYPVHQTTWHGAQAYCEWAGLRLPTEAEWEFAARGDTGDMYPWGDESVEGRCNRLGEEDGYRYTAPVHAFSEYASPAGCLNMAGNVAEWVQDWYAPFPPGEGVDPQGPAEPPPPDSGGYGPCKVVKGGSWALSWAPTLTTFDRNALEQNQGKWRYGFRVCLSPSGEALEDR